MYIGIRAEKEGGLYKMTTSDYCKIQTDTALFTLRTEVLEKKKLGERPPCVCKCSLMTSSVLISVAITCYVH